MRPSAIEHRDIKGMGHNRIEIDGSEISFYDEAVGIHVSFETGNLSAERMADIVADIQANIRDKLGEDSYVVDLNDPEGRPIALS